MNIGKVIRYTAVLGVGALSVGGFFLGGYIGGYTDIAIACGFVGFLLGWIQFAMLYGLGKLIDDVHRIRNKLCEEAKQEA